MMENNLATLFHAQSYQDALTEYQRVLNSRSATRWDYIVLTASNEQQAESFRAQLAERRSAGFLPSGTKFLVVPDPEGKRVGSGGATLNVLKAIAEEQGSADFSHLRILVIHSGGDSKRVPQYSALGKLFSSVPHELPNGRASTLFDEFMIIMSSVASRIREGMLLLSGDVLLLFNPLQIDFSGEGAAAISFKEPVEIGKNHGVYLRSESGYVAQCLQKKSVAELTAAGAVNAQNCVDIDTGAVIFSPDMLRALYELISRDGVFCEEAFANYVNDQVRLSLYADFLYPLAENATLEKFYLEKPEGEFSDALTQARTAVWEALRPYRMKLLRLAPSKFIHFGTTQEIMHLMSRELVRYESLGWSKNVHSSNTHPDVSAYASVLSRHANCGKHVFLEVSNVQNGAVIGDNTLLSYVDVADVVIPSNIVLHGLKQRDGRFVVRIYGVTDNPKAALDEGCSFLTTTLDAWCAVNAIDPSELWADGEPRSLWTADLYPACSTIREAIDAALNIYQMASGNGDVEAWRKADRKSLCSGFNEADPDALIAWNRRMQELVSMEDIANQIHERVSVHQIQTKFPQGELTKIQQDWFADRLTHASISEAIRLHYYLGRILGGAKGEQYIREAFRLIQKAIVEGTDHKVQERPDCMIAHDTYCVQLPLRVNWGGGWSDTPPYCNDCGGTVLNAAIKLNGSLPVEVTLRRIKEPRVIFDSRDMDAHGEYDTISALQSVGDPYDPFVLQKAALIACGLIPQSGGDLAAILQRIGGGFVMQTEVTGVPKGSGLGTSSILAAACVKALFGFFGIPVTLDELYSHVLVMEQIMSTGGGWQDQVGGLSDGIKMISAAPGLAQHPVVTQVNLPDHAWEELQERFCLIYTGQRRLARNLLRDVVGRYIGAEPDALYALNEIQRTAALMRFELERGHIDDFAKLLSAHWELSKMLDAGSTNTLIDQIFQSVDDLIDGRMICGAGGGGFLQVILKKGITREVLRERLRTVFQDSDVDVWECTIIKP